MTQYRISSANVAFDLCNLPNLLNTHASNIQTYTQSHLSDYDEARKRIPYYRHFYNLDNERTNRDENSLLEIKVEDFDEGYQCGVEKNIWIPAVHNKRTPTETKYMKQYYEEQFKNNSCYQIDFDTPIFHYPNTEKAINKVSAHSHLVCGCCNTITHKDYLIVWGSPIHKISEGVCRHEDLHSCRRGNRNVCFHCYFKYGVNYLTNYFDCPWVYDNSYICAKEVKQVCSNNTSHTKCNALVSKYDNELRALFNQCCDERDPSDADTEKLEDIEDAEYLYCPTCARYRDNPHIRVCGCCNESFTNNNIEDSTFDYADDHLEYICQGCRTENYGYCSDCGCFNHNDNLNDAGDTGETFCRNCVEDNCSFCECCEEYLEDRRVVYTTETDEHICEECWDTEEHGDYNDMLQREEGDIRDRAINSVYNNGITNDYRTSGNLAPCIDTNKNCIHCKTYVGEMCCNKECRKKERDRVGTYLEVHFNNELSKVRPITSGYDKEEECSICMEGECECYRSCGHKFHRSCIRQWHKNNFSCPLCRNTKYF